MTKEHHQEPHFQAIVTESDLQSSLVSHMVYEELARQASSHTGKQGRFVPLQWNPRDIHEDPESGYPGQLLEDYCIEANTQPGMESFIEAYGELFIDGFSKITNEFYENKPLLDSMREKLDSAENIIVVTNHGEIYDIAVILASLRVALGRHLQDNAEQPLSADRFNIIVHRMISQIGLPDEHDPNNTAPALSILQLIGETYLSFPRTENAKKARIPHALDKTCTELMLSKLSNKMSQGGQVLAFAPSGSKDESLRDRFGKSRKVIKPVNSGTHRLMRQEKTWVLGVGVALDQKDGAACSISDLVQCNTDEECHQLLESIADRHTLLTGIKTFYARKQADLDSWRAEATAHKQEQQPQNLETSRSIDAKDALLIGIGALAAGALLGHAISKRTKK
jgi:hypothetical protein